MGSKNDLVSKLIALVKGFDDASWEALASTGLLRRARKDLDKGLQVEIVEESEESLRLKVPPALVTMRASGPAKATCSCPAPGTCQHILIAGLYLQNLNAGVSQERLVATKDSILQEVSLIKPDFLRAWAGATDYRHGISLFEKNTLAPVIKYGETVTIRLMPSGIETRFVPGGGLDGMILPKPNGKRAGVAALLALRKSLGLEIPQSATQQSLVELTGTPRTKKEILDSACSVLEDSVSVGLSHVSPVLAERLVTLSVSSQGAHLPRVALALRTVADEVRSILKREARADEARLLLLISRVYALMDAIRSGGDVQSLQLAGSHRGQYIEVPELELSGVGAYTWQTGSGYVGLTVLFWANPTKEFLSWSYARPEIQRIDARLRFYGEGPWEGTQSPQQVAASSIKLRNARRTVNGRLSGSAKSSALVLSTVAPNALDFDDRLFKSWAGLRSYGNKKQPLGLRDPNPLELIVVLQPSAFGTRSFDSITQTFTWEVYDELNQSLTLTLPFRDWTKESIKILEQLSPPKEHRWSFVVRLTHEDGELYVEPISILRPEDSDKPVFQLAFDALPQISGVPSAQSAADDRVQSEEDDSLESIEVEVPARSALYGVITELNRRLEEIAETGAQHGLATQRDWFSRSRRDVHGLGLTALSQSLDSLAAPSSGAQTVLRARFLSHLHSQATTHLR